MALTAAERAAQEEADRRRAEFDAMGERLLALRAELAAHVDRYGDLGLRDRRARSRALRPVPAAPAAIPAPRAPGIRAKGTNPTDLPDPTEPTGVTDPTDLTGPTDPSGVARAAGPTGPTGSTGLTDVPYASGVRAGLGWLVPVAFFALTTVLGAGETGDTPLWLRVAARLVALAVAAELLRLWIPRRNWRTAGPMPVGTGLWVAGVFLGLAAASMFTDPLYAAGGAPWALAAVSALLVLAGVVRRGRAVAATG